MEKIKKNIRRVFWLYFLLFFIIGISMIKFIFIDSPSLVSNSYNPRLTRLDENILKGQIIDGEGNILAYSEKLSAEEGYTRIYPYGAKFAHAVGFSDKSRAGLEARYSLELAKLNLEIIQRIRELATGEPLKGNSIVVTLNSSLQEKAYKGLEGKKGAVVVLENSTGKILVNASSPGFDPNNVGDSWEALNADTDNSPFLNRATSGKYPPGSVFKILTATAAMREGCEDFTYTCTGQENFDGKKINCFNQTKHGQMDLHSAFTYSCNTYFAALGQEMGASVLRRTADELGINDDTVRFPLEEGAGISEIVETAIGQGRTLVTVMDTAELVSAIANDGRLMKPYVLDYALTWNGHVRNKQMPVTSAKIFSSEESQKLLEMMKSVVDTGTGKAAGIDGYYIAGKTGTAQNETGKDHGWFAAAGPTEKYEITVVVLLEGSGGSKSCTPIARAIFQEYISIGGVQ